MSIFNRNHLGIAQSNQVQQERDDEYWQALTQAKLEHAQRMLVGGAGGYAGPVQSVVHTAHQPSDRECITMRMRWDSVNLGSLKHLHTVRLPDKVIVLVVNKDNQHTVIEDSTDLFPSDTLITQLRMIAG